MNASQVESVWDYPRPPRLESSTRRLRVIHQGILLAESRQGMRVLETSHPPVYYFPPAQVSMHLLQRSLRRPSFCEFKGMADYWDLQLNGALAVKEVAWSYRNPSPAFTALKDYVAFYPGKLDECWVDEERVLAQPGDFYGGWITSNIAGPFKGAPGTMHW